MLALRGDFGHVVHHWVYCVEAVLAVLRLLSSVSAKCSSSSGFRCQCILFPLKASS